MQTLKVLSLFSGIGAFEKALDRLDIEYELEGYCEIDPYAAKGYSLIHNTEEWMNFKDVTKIDEKKLPKDIDLLTYGFPCQDISLAGNQKGLVDEQGNKTRSGLVWDATRIIKASQPKIAIAENVKNLVSKKFKTEFEAILKELDECGYNNYWKVLNAKEHGVAQNRERVFIVSIRKDIDMGLFEWPEKETLTNRLLDYLEDEDGNNQPHLELRKDSVSNALTTFDKDNVVVIEEGDGVYLDQLSRSKINREDGISVTIKAQRGHAGVVVKDMRNLKEKLCDELIESGTVKGGEVINHSYTNSQKKPNSRLELEDFIETKDGILPTLTTRGDTLGVVTHTPLRIRKLTPKECFRLMAFEDEDHDKLERAGISNSQRYKMAGNSIVVRVLEKILKNLIESTL